MNPNSTARKAVIISERTYLTAQLRQLIYHSEDYSEVAVMQDFRDPRLTQANPARFEIIFIGSEFDKNEIASFIEEVRLKNTRDQKIIFVLLLQAEEESDEVVGNSMLLGFHGFSVSRSALLP